MYYYNDSEKKAKANKISKIIIWISIAVLAVSIIGSILFIYTLPSGNSSSSASSHACCICGKTEGTTQITAQTKSGYDDNWYCEEHYASAWQYYYGDN